MADTRTQVEVEDWIRKKWLPAQFNQQFFRDRVPLSSGGVFDYDAVSSDRKIIALISTSSSTTSGGKQGVGKLQKIRADMFFMLLTPNFEKKIIVLTETDMFEKCNAEIAAGRAPKEIKFMYAEIPDVLRARLIESREKASKEVKPKL
jgi:hypothetical protein